MDESFGSLSPRQAPKKPEPPPPMPLGYPAGFWFYPPPPNLTPKKPDLVRRWLTIGVALLVVGFLAFMVVGATRLFNEGIVPPRDVAVGYFAALKAHDWQAAHDHLSPALRAANSPADLERTWLRREQANGTLDRFEAATVNVRSFNGVTTGTVSGTVHHDGGASDPKLITLIREGEQWRLATLP